MSWGGIWERSAMGDDERHLVRVILTATLNNVSTLEVAYKGDAGDLGGGKQ